MLCLSKVRVWGKRPLRESIAGRFDFTNILSQEQHKLHSYGAASDTFTRLFEEEEKERHCRSGSGGSERGVASEGGPRRGRRAYSSYFLPSVLLQALLSPLNGVNI